MLIKHFIFCTVFIVTSLALNRNPFKQPTFLPHKEESFSYLIKLDRHNVPVTEHKKLITVLQQAYEGLRSSSFLQREIQPINIDNLNGTRKIGIGTKEPLYTVVFDTGSTPFFVASSLCNQSACLERNRFNFEVASTLSTKEPLLGLTVVYGSGIVTGVLSEQDVYVGSIKVNKMQVFLIQEQQGILDNAEFDGVVGLAFPQKQEGKPTIISLFDAMKDQLPEEYFSFYLRRNEEPDSYIMFGGYNTNHMASPLVWHDVIHPDYWMLLLTDVYVGDKSIEFCKVYKCGVVIDSGTSLLTAPTQAMMQMQSLLGIRPCAEIQTLPSLSFQIDDYKYELTASEYVITIDKNGNPEFFTHSEDATECMGLFHPIDMQTTDGIVVFILGDSFFTKFYTVFDRKNRRIGMALQKRDEKVSS